MPVRSVVGDPTILSQSIRGKAQQAAIAALTDSSGGTADGTIADVEASYTEATLANNFADLAAKVASILTALRNVNIIAT